MSRKTKLGIGLAIVAVLAACALYLNTDLIGNIRAASVGQEDAANETRPPETSIPVRLGEATVREFERTLQLQGTIEARETALVPARQAGTLEALYVDEGDRVIKGKTRLFQTDPIKFEQMVARADQQLAVERCTVDEKRAIVNKAQADLAQAKLDDNRYTELFAQQAVTSEELEQRHTDLLRAQAEVKVAEAQADLAGQQLKQAEVELSMARKDLADTVVLAPIDGVISEKLAELGEMGERGKAIFRIDQVEELEVSVYAPSEHLGQILPGKTVARLRTPGSDESVPLTVTYCSPTVDRRLRTFEVKCRLPGGSAAWRPGQMVELSIVLEHHESIGVPAESVLRRRSGWVIYTVDDAHARQLQVVPGLENDGWLALADGAVTAGMPIVVMGQFLLNDQSAVTIQRETN